jgi:NADPH-dependent glutamate synthase beta subunit-like oxidoreductase
VSVETVVDNAGLIPAVQRMMGASARFVTATAVDEADKYEIVYTFDVGNLELSHVRLLVKKGEKVPSIAGIFPSAFLVENEIQDCFGLEFVGLPINAGGHLILEQHAMEDPLCKPGICPEPSNTRKTAPCREACPAGIDVPRYVRLISEGKEKEALAVVLEQNPLPAICGRVCFAPCETACRQSLDSTPVAIRFLKRYISDTVGIENYPTPQPGPDTGKKIAIIGAGPAGLTAAFYLRAWGHSATIFDELPVAGGMMRVGIPDYRLPPEILDKEVARITGMGVDLKLNTHIGSVDELFNQGFDAVYVATGAHKNKALRCPGEDLDGVLNCVTFLKEINISKSSMIGERVAVVGGGNSAIDAARVALRSGAKEVHILYRRTRKEMPATEAEIVMAEEEGIKITYLVAPMKVTRTAGGRLGLELQKMELGPPDSSGRRSPVPIAGSEYVEEFDNIITAIGQGSSVPKEMGAPIHEKWGSVLADKEGITSRKGVYAGGDVVRGPSSVIESIADGKAAATSIDHFLGFNHHAPSKDLVKLEFVHRSTREERASGGKERVHIPELEPSERKSNYKEVELEYTRDQAKKESARCWKCDWNE